MFNSVLSQRGCFKRWLFPRAEGRFFFQHIPFLALNIHYIPDFYVYFFPLFCSLRTPHPQVPFLPTQSLDLSCAGEGNFWAASSLLLPQHLSPGHPAELPEGTLIGFPHKFRCSAAWRGSGRWSEVGTGLLLECLVQMPLWASALGFLPFFQCKKMSSVGQVFLHREQNQSLLVLSPGNIPLGVLSGIRSLFV